MNYCLDCGNELGSESFFCENCGAKVEQKEMHEMNSTPMDRQAEPYPAPDQNVEVPNQNQRTDIPKKPMSKKTKIIWSAVVIFCILLFGTHKWLGNYFDPMKQLAAMNEAIAEEDAEVFFKHVELKDDALLDKESLFEYIREEEWDEYMVDEFIDILEEEQMNPSLLDQEIVSDYYGGTIFKVKNKKHLGIYPGFTLQAIPTDLELYVNMDDAIISIGDKEIEVKDSDEPIEVGKVYPGVYEVTGDATGEYGDFEFQDELEIYAADRMEVGIDFEYLVAEINPSYTFSDAILFIDGEKTDHTLDDYVAIGPLPEDKNMEFYAEWTDENKDAIRSNTVQLKDLDDYYGIDFEFDETKVMSASVTNTSDHEDEKKKSDDTDKKKSTDETSDGVDEEEAGQFVLAFRDAYENAVNAADFTEVESFLNDGSQARKELNEFITDMGDADYYYDFKENTVLDVKRDGDQFTVKTNEKFYFIDDDGEEYDYDRDKNYTIELVDNEFQINEIDYADTKKNKAN